MISKKEKLCLVCMNCYNSLKKKHKDKIFMDSVDKSAHKLLPSFISNKGSEKEIKIIDPANGLLSNIMDESLILNSLMPEISIQRIYADKEIGAIIREEITKELGEE